MSCVVTSHTNAEIEEMVIKNTYLKVSKDETISDLITRLDSMQGKAALVEVPNDRLKTGAYLDPSGVTKRYSLLWNPDVIIPGRATDVNKEAFVKSKGAKEAAEISAKPINKIKAEVGTKLHNIADQIYLHLISSSSNLYSDKKPETSMDQLLKDSGLSKEDFTNLKNAVNSIVTLTNNTQKQIDPTKKAKVYTEMFLLDLGGKIGAVGRTLDLVVVYSDKTASHFDYKFKSPNFDKKTKDPITGRYEVSSYDWIDKYNKEDYDRQIGRSAEVLKKQYGVTGMRHNRVIPAHFELKYENKNPTTKVTQLSIGESMNKYLTQIPIGSELTDSKLKSISLDNLSKIKNNLEEQLENTTLQAKRFLIIDKIKKLDESIKLIQISNDISGVLSLYKSLVDKYTDAVGNTKLNLRDEEVNGILNPYYIDESDLVNLYQELGLIQKMVNSPEWYNEMTKDLADTRIEAINNAKDEFNKRIGLMLSNLEEEMVNRTLSLVEQAQIEDTIDLGMFEKWFQTFGQINHPIFIKAKSLLDKANNKTRIESQQFFEELKTVTKELQKEQGSKGYNTFNILINKQTGNLHATYKPEFWSMISEARESGNIEVLKKYLTLKPDAQKRFEEYREKVKARSSKETFATWEKEHPSLESMLTTKYYHVYYDINKEASEEFYSEGYKEILKYPAAKKYYEFWTENMKKFKDYLDIDAGDKVPNNFIPWIKADTLEQVLQGNFGTTEVLKNMKDILAVHEATETFGQLSGKIDLRTGDTLHQIPKWFINPLFDTEGNPNVREKSYDLSKSLMVFASTAMEYNNMKEIEGTIMALKEVLALTTVTKIDKKGGIVSNLLGDKAKILNPEIDTLFNDMVNYHLYGVKLKGNQNEKFIEVMRKTKSLTQKIELGLSPLTMLGSFTATMMSRWQEAGKGYYFNSAQVVEARKILIGLVADKNIAILKDKSKVELARALCGFFEPHQGKQTLLKAQDLSANKLVGKWLDNVLFWGYRKGDELNENAVMLAMMQNYGLHNGKISRLKNLPEGTKSLLEISSIKDGKLIIEGITDGKDVNIDLYTSFRNMVMNVNKGIKGSMNEEDMNAVNMNLLGNMMMSFKNWMPGLAEERFAGIKYNVGTQAITIGRWRAVSSDIPSLEEAGFLRLAASTIGKIGLVLADGLTFSKLGVYKVNQERTKALFEKFQEANSNNPEIQDMSFEDFLDYKQGQIKALARESIMVLALLGMVVLMSGADFDDDDEPDWKKTIATRIAYRLINRTRRELMFFINPTEILATAGNNALPQIGLATKSLRLLSNTFDEIRDNTFGENNERDKKNEFSNTVKFIPGFKLATSIFEPLEGDEDKEL